MMLLDATIRIAKYYDVPTKDWVALWYKEFTTNLEQVEKAFGALEIKYV